jgi:hypothetical protein
LNCAGATIDYEEKSPGVPLFASMPASDVNHGNVVSIKITVENCSAADTIRVGGPLDSSSITKNGCSWTIQNGTVPVAAETAAQILQSVTFESSRNDNHTAHDRTTKVKTELCAMDVQSEAEKCGDLCITTLNVVQCGDCLPQVAQCLPPSSMTTLPHFVQNHVPVYVDQNITLTDSDNDVHTACVKLVGIEQNPADRLLDGNNGELANGQHCKECQSKQACDTWLRGLKFHSQPATDGSLNGATREVQYQFVDAFQNAGPTCQRLVEVNADVGHYEDPSDSTIRVCPRGKYQGSVGKSTCESCPAGTQGSMATPVFNRTSIEHCELCTAGKYQNTGGLDEDCKPCLAGQFQSADGKVTCTACPMGQHQDYPAQTKCKDCPYGHYNDGKDTSETAGQLCKAWTCCYNGHRQVGGTDHCDAFCVPCHRGRYLVVQPTQPLSEPFTEAAARAAGLCHSNTTCTTCPAGTFGSASIPTDSARHCVACEAGKYSTLTSKNADGQWLENELCSDCAAGEFQSQTGQISCESCDSGAISQDGAAHCQACSAGQYGVDNGEDAPSCVACPAGEFQEATGQITCNECIEGQYQPDDEQTACKSCPHGEYASVKKSIACTVCDEGKYAGQGRAECSICPEGKFQNSNNQCQFCSEGKYKNWVGDEDCLHCPAGQYQDGDDYETCQPCPAGKFGKPNVPYLLCEMCARGQYTASSNSTACEYCDHGKYTPQAQGGATECVNCQAGKYSESGDPECGVCPAGKFQNGAGEATCITCAAGKFNDRLMQTSATACKDCEPGRYASVAGQSSCDNTWKCCEPGHFLSFATLVADLVENGKDGLAAYTTSGGECELCPSGHYQEQSGCARKPCKEHKQECPPGHFLKDATETSDGTCTACPVGKYKLSVQAGGTLTNCVACGRGRYGLHAGFDYNPPAGQTFAPPEVCAECAAGQYSSPPEGEGADSCTQCVEGEYTDGAAVRDQCHACAALVLTPWAKAGKCDKICGSGLQRYARTLSVQPELKHGGVQQCPEDKTEPCNTQACPETHVCEAVKCRFRKHASSGGMSVQVWHPVADGNSAGASQQLYHRCLLYEEEGSDGLTGNKKCQCTCHKSKQELADAQSLALANTQHDPLSDLSSP